MAILNIGESLYTRSIKDLIKRIHDATPVRDSVYEMASDYYKNLPDQKAEIARIEAKIQNAQDTLSKTTRKPVIADLEDQIKGWKIELKNFHTEIDNQRIKRRNKLVQVCLDILDLLDGANFLEENNRAAKLLGTVFMIQPDEGRRRLTLNGRAKHLYKACLSLRLLDRLLSADLIKDPFIKNRADILKQSQNGNVEMAQATYRDDIKIPLIMACLLQDIGRMHPDAQRILHGPDRNMNEFRTLSLEERTQLLQITSIQTMLFVRDGIGLGRYVGNSREERDQFVRLEQLRLSFILRVIKSSITGEGDIGDLIKIPQIYSSVVLSTKENNQLHQTPLAMMILKRGAESGRFSKAAWPPCCLLLAFSLRASALPIFRPMPAMAIAMNMLWLMDCIRPNSMNLCADGSPATCSITLTATTSISVASTTCISLKPDTSWKKCRGNAY
ncbi:hypothetical protein ACFQMB_02410 [Pseudobowmanella zhangzhouensis]|uniref:hypothetical protein n=1 Tax=Pseudobowmanella zhangzhouensis TaxID=1537679 RepID=UPI003619AFFE